MRHPFVSRPTLPLCVLMLAIALPGCRRDGSPAEASTSPTTSATSTSTSTEETTAEATVANPTATTEVPPPTTHSTGTTTRASGRSSSGTTGGPACAKNVVLMGYWPPTNEMLRPWSQNRAQNPGGWVGQDWEGYGYDVYAFFPEFPPDGDPTNDSIGDDGAVGSPRFPLRVDYQATSADFWPIVDELRPVILITTSRGGGIGWEIEAIEGGHDGGVAANPALDWSSDQHGAVTRPTEATVLPRSWDAISTYRAGNTLPTALPVDEIFAAADGLGLTSVEVDFGTSGNFLSGFLGLHGLVYRELNPSTVAAGHIHVGFGLPVSDASQLIEATLHAVLQQYPVDTVECPPDR
ncbi:MAG: hypothetical protein AB1Z98_24200 [Nannocystaceae bacterium]